MLDAASMRFIGPDRMGRGLEFPEPKIPRSLGRTHRFSRPSRDWLIIRKYFPSFVQSSPLTALAPSQLASNWWRLEPFELTSQRDPSSVPGPPTSTRMAVPSGDQKIALGLPARVVR